MSPIPPPAARRTPAEHLAQDVAEPATAHPGLLRAAAAVREHGKHDREQAIRMRPFSAAWPGAGAWRG
jgi:hypothetical protein